MKLIPKAKPVKIRISYLGQEHFSLNSLKNTFSCKEIVSILDKPLVKWLNQQNETIVAENVAHLVNNRDRITPFSIVTAFFPEYENEELSDEAICKFWIKNNYEENARHFLEEKPLSPNEITPELKSIIIQLYRNENEEKLAEFGLDKKQIWQENLKLAKTGDKNALDYIKQIVPIQFQYDNLDDLDLLFLNKEAVGETDIVKNICIALDFWAEQGLVEERNNFIKDNKIFFSKVSLLRPYVINEKFKDIISKLSEISNASDLLRYNKKITNREDFYSLFNSHMKNFTSEELLQCVIWTVNCINDKPITNSTNSLKSYFKIFNIISKIKRDLNNREYTSKNYDILLKNSSHRPYYQVLYNVLNCVLGFGYADFDNLTYTYAYCDKVIPGVPSTAIKTLNIICQSLLFSEKEFSARNNIIYIG